MSTNKEILARVLPFAGFMIFILFEELIGFFTNDLGLISIASYASRTLVAAALLIIFRRCYTEIDWSDLKNLKSTLLSVSAGIAVYVLWVRMDFTLPFQDYPSNEFPWLAGPGLRHLAFTVKFLGMVLVVPVMEELFWRSFLARYLIRADFTSVAVGTFTFFSFAATSIFFGLEHVFILAGVMAGVVYHLVMLATKSIGQCIIAHFVTNLVLFIHIIYTDEYIFW